MANMDTPLCTAALETMFSTHELLEDVQTIAAPFGGSHRPMVLNAGPRIGSNSITWELVRTAHSPALAQAY